MDNRMKGARERAGYTLEGVVAALSRTETPISMSKLQRVENTPCHVRLRGRRFDPADLSTRELEAFAALYGVAPAVLLGRAPFPEQAPLAEAV